MITSHAGQVLYDTPGIRLLWSVSLKNGNHWLRSLELNADGNGTVTDKEFGMPNEQVAGKLRVLSDRSVLSNPDSSAITMGQLGKTILLYVPLAAVCDDGNRPNTITMLGLKNDKTVEGEVTETFEKLGSMWTDKETTIPSPFQIPVDDERTGDRKFVWTSTMLTTSTYNLDPKVHHVEAKVKRDAQTLSRDGQTISAPAHLEATEVYRRAGLGRVYCVTCHRSLSYDLGACRHCLIPHDRLLDKVRMELHANPQHTNWHHRDPIVDGGLLPTCDRCMIDYFIDFEHNLTLSWDDKVRADNETWKKFNNTAAHIFGIDIRLVPRHYRQWIRRAHGDDEWANLELRCERRSRAELREVASLVKPIVSQSNCFKQRCEAGEKSGPELNGELSDDNWLRQFICHENRYFWQFQNLARKVPAMRGDWWPRFAKQFYIEEISVCAHWMYGNSLCKANLGQQCSFPYTDYHEVRKHRHFAAFRDNKPNQRLHKGTPLKSHNLIQDAGFKDNAAVPAFNKPLFRDEIFNGRVSSVAMILTIIQVGGYTGEHICHPNLWPTQIFSGHVRRLAQLEDEDNPIVFSGDGIPQISPGLISGAMIDINQDDPLYRPKPRRRLVANHIESLVAQCVETVKTSAQPDVHHVIEERHRAWDLIIDSGTELRISGIPGLRIYFDRTRIIPRTFSAALASGKLMSLRSTLRMTLCLQQCASGQLPSTLARDGWMDTLTTNVLCCVILLETVVLAIPVSSIQNSSLIGMFESFPSTLRILLVNILTTWWVNPPVCQ